MAIVEKSQDIQRGDLVLIDALGLKVIGLVLSGAYDWQRGDWSLEIKTARGDVRYWKQYSDGGSCEIVRTRYDFTLTRTSDGSAIVTNGTLADLEGEIASMTYSIAGGYFVTVTQRDFDGYIAQVLLTEWIDGDHGYNYGK